MEKAKYTLGEFVDMINKLEMDIDVSVDGTDCYIALCAGTKMTEDGKKHFAEALALPMEGHCIMSYNEKDYDDYEANCTGTLALAEEFLYSAAGYCSITDWERWFIE